MKRLVQNLNSFIGALPYLPYLRISKLNRRRIVALISCSLLMFPFQNCNPVGSTDTEGSGRVGSSTGGDRNGGDGDGGGSLGNDGFIDNIVDELGGTTDPPDNGGGGPDPDPCLYSENERPIVEWARLYDLETDELGDYLITSGLEAPYTDNDNSTSAAVTFNSGFDRFSGSTDANQGVRVVSHIDRGVNGALNHEETWQTMQLDNNGDDLGVGIADFNGQGSAYQAADNRWMNPLELERDDTQTCLGHDQAGGILNETLTLRMRDAIDANNACNDGLGGDDLPDRDSPDFTIPIRFYNKCLSEVTFDADTPDNGGNLGAQVQSDHHSTHGTWTIVSEEGNDDVVDNGGKAYVFSGDSDFDLNIPGGTTAGAKFASVDIDVRSNGDVFAIVGTRGNASLLTGSVLVFKYDGTSAFEQIATLRKVSGTENRNRFGYRVAISGSNILVVSLSEGSGDGLPRIHLFNAWDSCTSAAPCDLTPNNTYTPSRSGYSYQDATISEVVLDGNIGAFQSSNFLNSPPYSTHSDVHTFTISGGAIQFVELAEVPIGLNSDAEDFGFTMDIAGNDLLIAAPRADYIDGGETRIASGRLFQYSIDNGGDSTLQREIDYPSAENDKRFGESIKITDSYFFVGSLIGGRSDGGTVNIFDRSLDDGDGNPRHLYRTQSVIRRSNQQFGAGVGGSDNVIVIGAPQYGALASDAGRIFIQDLETSKFNMNGNDL